MLSIQTKQLIDLFINECLNWSYNTPKPEFLKLETKLIYISDYLYSLGFYINPEQFDTFATKNIDLLFEEFKKNNPDFNEKSNSSGKWHEWHKIKDEYIINTISITASKTNPNFDSILAEELYEQDIEYNIPEEIPIKIHVDIYEGDIYLELIDEY